DPGIAVPIVQELGFSGDGILRENVVAIEVHGMIRVDKSVPVAQEASGVVFLVQGEARERTSVDARLKTEIVHLEAWIHRLDDRSCASRAGSSSLRLVEVTMKPMLESPPRSSRRTRPTR